MVNAVKRCVKCDAEHPATLEFFYSCATARDRLRSECKSCLNSISHQSRRVLRQERKRLGLCFDCKAPVVEGKTHCESCAKLQQGHNKRRYARKVAAGLCPSCKHPADGSTKMCTVCREDLRSRSIDRRAARRSNGLCKDCGNPANATPTYCLDDWFKAACRNATGRVDVADALRVMMEAQNWMCAYTGRKLVPGKNASIDHKQPRARGGARADIANLQWVDLKVNLLKNDSTHEEFVALCQAVVSRFASESISY